MQAQTPVGWDGRTEAAAAFHELLCAWRESGIHPVAWGAFLHTTESNALQFELRSNQSIQFHTFRHDIAAQYGCAFSLYAEHTANLFVHLVRKKCNLAFVILFVVKKSVAAYTTRGNTINLGDLYCLMVSWRSAMVSEKIMSARNIQMPKFHRMEYSAPNDQGKLPVGKFQNFGDIANVFWANA